MSTAKSLGTNFDTFRHNQITTLALIEHPELMRTNHPLGSQPGSGLSEFRDLTKQRLSGGLSNNSAYRNSASKARLSISPIRYARPARPTQVCPTQQLSVPFNDAKDGSPDIEHLSTPVIYGRSILSNLDFSSPLTKNISNHLIGEETPADYAIDTPLFRDVLTPNGRLAASGDKIAIKEEATADHYYYDSFPTDLSKSLGSPSGDVGSTIDYHETVAPEKHVYVDFDIMVAKFPIKSNQPFMSPIGENTLDGFSLSSNGSFDLETFPSTESETVVPTDPKGIYAMKSMKMKSDDKSKRKPKQSKMTKSSKKSSNSLPTQVCEPTDLDILRGRGGLTNRHPGNMKFRDEARKLRSEYRHCDTSRQEKFALSQKLVKIVKEYGGRFLEMGDDKLWHEMSSKASRKKASQVLREEKWD